MGEAELALFVAEHKVAYDFAPQVELVRGARLHTGLTLQLFAEPPHASTGDPGDDAVGTLWGRLRELALAVLPPATPPAAYAVLPFHAAFHLRPETGFAPEVMLALVLYEPGGGSASGQHPFEREAARAFEERLRTLGVQHRVWRARRD